MRCDAVQRRLSDGLDGPLPAADRAAVDDHLEGCEACTAFHDRLEGFRRQLRVVPLEAPPDIAGQVRDRLEQRVARRRGSSRTARPRFAPAAAVFVVGFAVGAAGVGLAGPQRASAVDLERLVREAAHRVETLEATVAVVEHGWHPEVPVRTYRGSLRYEAPETFSLELDDRTPYPPGPWQENDTALVVDDARAWSRGPVSCPRSALPQCTPAAPRVEVVTGREPFDRGEPVPLDLVVPVGSFGLSSTTAAASSGEVGGREAVVVTVPAAQIQPVLDGLLQVGNWRGVHPSDAAEVALDADHGVPLSVVVTASGGSERRSWAVASGYDDRAGDVLLTWRLDDVAINQPSVSVPTEAPVPSEGTVDRGFLDGTAAGGPRPTWLPEGMTPHRAGHVGDIAIGSWTDGRAWLRIRARGDWDRPRLFGRSGGQLVRRVVTGTDDVVYLAEGGRQVFVHTADLDVEVAGSLPIDQLLRVTAGLGLRGIAVPDGWAEASSATLGTAVAAVPGLLVPPDDDVFLGPAVRVEDGTVGLGYVGNGARGFVLTQGRADQLSPPLDAVVMGVAVRRTTGRYTPRTGELEWVEDGAAVSLRSGTLSLAELLAIAHGLERAS